MRVVMIFVLVFVLGAVSAALTLHARQNWFASLDFQLSSPGVPNAVTRTIRAAEIRALSGKNTTERALAGLQDLTGFFAPRLAYTFNLPVGLDRIPAARLQEMLPWAIERNYATLGAADPDDVLLALVYFAKHPGFADWNTAIYLEFLRQRHPALSILNWDAISANPQLIAKLYSGYLGAGGDWDTWEAHVRPGPIAAGRLGL